ncbi:MAG: lysophospholipid acyltransferase family protein [Deltaproteobacteria bacterium]|nr:lysophospholipid acyltransferase family protein [Deltaproteobacteria bacterium]
MFLVRGAKNGLIYLLVRGLLAVSRLVPGSWLVRLFEGLGRAGAHLARYERRRALRNLAASELRLEGALARRVWSHALAHVGRSLGECLVLLRGGRQARAVREQITFSPGGIETLRGALAEGHGVVLTGAHFGNWELLVSALAMHTEASQTQIHVLARPSYDPRFSFLLERLRARLGCRTIWVRGGRSHLRHCLGALSQGEVVALAADQPAPRGAESMAFLGRMAPTSMVAPSLAHKSGAPLLWVLSERQGGRHHIIIERIPVARDLSRKVSARQATAVLCERLGEAVVRCPEQWLWSLDRWRENLT